MTKPDFSKIFAQNGALAALTDAQFLQGFDYLGDNPPTKEEFNWLFQRFCLQLQWLESHQRGFRQNSTAYTTGDIAYSLTLPNYAYLECIQDGTTAATEPAWPAVGEEVTDGTVRWRVRDIKSGSGESIGSIKACLSNTPPPGWLALDTGAEVGRETYPQLWAWVQENAPLITEAEWQAQAAVQSSVGFYSSGDGSTTFRLPRLLDYPRGGLASEVGTWQGDAIRNITGRVGLTATGKSNIGSTFLGDLIESSGAFALENPGTRRDIQEVATLGYGCEGFTIDASRVVQTADENRPKTIRMLYCVKAFDAVTNPGLISITELANELLKKVNYTDFISWGNSVNGGRKLPDGTIIQWGSAGASLGDAITTITLPVAFPNVFSAAFATVQYTNAVTGDSVISAHAYKLSNSQIKIGQSGIGITGTDVSWFAIGY